MIEPHSRDPEDLSPEAVKLARHLQALHAGCYIIKLTKGDGRRDWYITITEQRVLVDRAWYFEAI